MQNSIDYALSYNARKLKLSAIEYRLPMDKNICKVGQGTPTPPHTILACNYINSRTDLQEVLKHRLFLTIPLNEVINEAIVHQ